MRQRVSVVTLGVRDLPRARRFYETLGWATGAQPGDDVVFFQAGDMVLSLWDRASVFVDPEGHPWEIAHNPHWTLTPDGALRLA